MKRFTYDGFGLKGHTGRVSSTSVWAVEKASMQVAGRANGYAIRVPVYKFFFEMGGHAG